MVLADAHIEPKALCRCQIRRRHPTKKENKKKKKRPSKRRGRTGGGGAVAGAIHEVKENTGWGGVRGR